MKYVRKIDDISTNFLENLLIERGILVRDDTEENNKFLFPSKENLETNLLDNLEEGYQLINKHLNNRIYIVVDSDVDGFTSAAATYLYIKKLNPNANVEYHIPVGKEHGLETIIDYLEEGIADLVICPDAASNDFECHRRLKDIGCDVLCLDHHLCSGYSKDAVVVNNQLSENYKNKALSGVGVVYKFLEYCDSKFNVNYSKEFIDLVALGQIGDMMELTTLENRYLHLMGLSSVNCEFLKELITKQSFSITDTNNPIPMDISFYVVPLINALIRVGTPLEKERLFLAFVTPNVLVPSTKRGEKGLEETIVTQVVRSCVNARLKQNKEKDKAGELLDIQIFENELNENKVLILNADEIDIPTTLTGLLAMRVAAQYNKPVMIGRTNNKGEIRGSIRGCGDSELKDFRQLLLDSGLMDYVEG